MQIHPRFALAAPRRARVEIIPLIDVVFFLLATFVLFVFMMSATRAIQVTLPHPGKDTGAENVVLQVTEGDKAFWNQEPISVAELPSRLAAYRNSTADPRVLLTGDDKVHWGPLVQALDEVRKAGIKNFSIETRPRPTGR